MALTNKQRVFVAEYVVDFNATRAAIAAGYSENSAANIGYENVRKPDIAAEIERTIAHRCMTQSEVLTRLTEHARGDVGDFINVVDGVPSFDFSAASEQGKMRIIRKLKTKTKTYLPKDPDADTTITETEVDFELYDAQAALVHIGRIHKMFVDRTESKDDSTLKIEYVNDWRAASE